MIHILPVRIDYSSLFKMIDDQLVNADYIFHHDICLRDLDILRLAVKRLERLFQEKGEGDGAEDTNH